jgi:hypothetical protein
MLGCVGMALDCVTFCELPEPHGAKGGHCVRETSALQAGPLCAGNRSKA